LADFTGERVIPGLVEADLWNEHLARYLFASTLARGKRVLDAGCGTGYGTHILAQQSGETTGFDISPDAIGYAREHYNPGATFMLADVMAIPAGERSFDLITAFEVIEHLTDWPKLITEAARVITDGGLFMVSTPNKSYYAETRREKGPNQFHVHEFEYEEFREAFTRAFPHIRILAQNQTQAITFSGDDTCVPTEATFGETAEPVASGHFYLAVCSRSPIPPLSFVYVPKTGNILRERERHIALLQLDLAEAREEHQRLLNSHWELENEFEVRGKWAEELTAEVEKARGEISALIEQRKLLRNSRWMTLGRRLGLGPQLPDLEP
jgi:ubiquinone/menaquinone biosynthesis C-methylase UbiE